jgi:hypothetical protein
MTGFLHVRAGNWGEAIWLGGSEFSGICLTSAAGQPTMIALGSGHALNDGAALAPSMRSAIEYPANIRTRYPEASEILKNGGPRLIVMITTSSL